MKQGDAKVLDLKYMQTEFKNAMALEFKDDDEKQSFVEEQIKLVKDRSSQIRRSISGTGASYHQLVGIQKLGSSLNRDQKAGLRFSHRSGITGRSSQPSSRQGADRPRGANGSPGAIMEVDSQASDFSEGIVDELAAREWRTVLQQCQKYRRELVSINFPPFDGQHEDIHIFAGFVKPGRHVIVIYDPERKKFYRKDILVEVRKGGLIIESGKKMISQNQNDNSIFKQWRDDDEKALR